MAIPARDEADRMGACLGALRNQRHLDGSPLPTDAIRIVVLANNCADATAEIARQSGSFVQVVERTLPPGAANAGVARRAAMDAAADLLTDGGAGIICTTDADSRPRPDWIARLWKAVDAGAGAVAGAVDFDPCELSTPTFSEGRRLEGLYSALQAEITAWADPEAHNPWPNHIWAWGANLAVTAKAYRDVGGLPPHPIAEDRAFVDHLRRHDVPVRHCLDARVWTSARRVGRAPGGLASLVDDHAGRDDAPCDAVLEPARLAWRRAAWRRRMRHVYLEGSPPAALPLRLGVPAATLNAALEAETFGTAWSLVQAASPHLAPSRLSLADLPVQIARAARLVRWISAPGPDGPADRLRAASAGLWSTPAISP